MPTVVRQSLLHSRATRSMSLCKISRQPAASRSVGCRPVLALAVSRGGTAPDAPVAQQRQAARMAATDDTTLELVSLVRRKTSPGAASANERRPGPVTEFMMKCKAAYRIFFPEQNRNLTPKEEGRNRLRMILVADRCAMSSASLTNMKSSIVAAVSNYVEVETEDLVEVNVTTDDDLGTIYSVAVPVKRVKPTARIELEDSLEGIAELQWDDEDPDADLSSRFPYGT